MAIRLTDAYPNRSGSANSDYPHGSIVNESAPDAGDGTPLEKQWGNDVAGFMQALIETGHITPNGTPDTAPSSQHLDALLTVTRGMVDVDVGGSSNVTLDNYDQVAMLRLTGTLTADLDLILPDTKRHYLIINEASGDFDITVKTSAGTGVLVHKNDPHWVYVDGTNVQTLLYSKRAVDTGLGKMVGEPFMVWDDLTGAQVPDNSGKAKFIKLTAGEDGVGGFNEGLLTGESVTGTSPNIDATATIDHPDSPLNGVSVHLINTEGRFIRPGTSGVLQDDQNAQHSHTGSTGTSGSHSHSLNFSSDNNEFNRTIAHASGKNRIIEETVDAGGSGSSSSPVNSNGNHSHSISVDNSGGDEARPRNIGATYYMRIA